MTRVKVKICGITRLDDALMAVDYGVDLLGFNFYPGSKRYIEPAQAANICRDLKDHFRKKCPTLIGLFVNLPAEQMQAIMAQVPLDGIQLSGDEPPAAVQQWDGRAFRSIRPTSVEQAADEVQAYSIQPVSDRLPALLLDAYQPGAYGGTGVQAADDIAQAVIARVPRLLLAGGLTPDNVGERVRTLRPWGVDVASGVESGQPGVKDAAKVKAFIEAVWQAETP